MESEVWTFERIMEEIHKEYHVVPMNLKNIMDIFDDHLKLGDALDKLNEDELKYFRLHLQNSKIIRENALTHTIYHEKIQENRKNTTLYYLMESFNSVYLTQNQNHYLQQNIDYIEIHNKFNQYQEPQFKYRSITSLIKKK